MDYQIIHNIPGRIRFLIPRLVADPDYVQRLQGLVESIKFVTEARINPWAKSLIVSYKTRAISHDVIQKHLIVVIEQAEASAPSVSQEKPTATPSPSVPNSAIEEKPTSKTSPPVSHSAIEQKTSNEAAKTIPQEEPPTSISQKFVLAEDPWDEDSKSNETSPSVTESADEEMVPLKQEVASIETPPAKESQLENKKEKAVSSLSTAALAKRLHVASQTLTRNRSKPNFVDWTQAKDPEGVAWKYDLKSKTFYRIVSPERNSETG
jgi:Heavy metal associated domain 2